MEKKLLILTISFLVLTTESCIFDKDYVDLGLPSGTLWGTCNIGASTPEEYGDYFAWGETEGYNSGKNEFHILTYKYVGRQAGSTQYLITKYNSLDYCFMEENHEELEWRDDAAYVNCGDKWVTPSIEQMKELINSNYTTTEWITQNNVYGRKITSKSNGNSIFLPAAGHRVDDQLEKAGSSGYYWSCSRSSSPWGAHILIFSSSNIKEDSYDRFWGLSIRPVRK